jgi:eukaryotic-like serine/threonine-protein kinase
MTADSNNTTDDLRPGSLLQGRYRIGEVLGRGGLATVYRADDESLGRTVALKVISGSAGELSDSRRHDDEVRLIASFHHPGLVTLFDVTTLDDSATTVLVMQFVDGVTLASRISMGALPSHEVAAIGADVASALALVHGGKVMHRDVKPANILLPRDATVSNGQTAVLADFGIARLVDDAGITGTGLIVGTASYLSPEQAHGTALTPATDIYSLGLVLLEALTGEKAFPGSAVESVAARLSVDPLVPDSIDPEVATLLRSMVDRDPKARPKASVVDSRLRDFVSAGDAKTKVLPAAGTTATVVLGASSENATTVAFNAPSAPMAKPQKLQKPQKPSKQPRAPFPVRRALIVVAIVLAAALTIFAIASAASFLANLAGPATTPIASGAPSPTETATGEPAVGAPTYPAVEGQLGDDLRTLQESVAALESADNQQQLQNRVLTITQLSADGDYQGARDAVDSMKSALKGAQLTDTERKQISAALGTVQSDLDGLLKPGKGSKPGKGKKD